MLDLLERFFSWAAEWLLDLKHMFLALFFPLVAFFNWLFDTVFDFIKTRVSDFTALFDGIDGAFDFTSVNSASGNFASFCNAYIPWDTVLECVLFVAALHVSAAVVRGAINTWKLWPALLGGQ